MARNQAEKQQRRNKVIMVFLVAIMVLSGFSAVFFGFGDQGAKKKYSGFTFLETPQGYYVSVEGQRLGFDYYPTDLEDMNIDAGALAALKDKVQLDISSNLNDALNQSIALVEYNMLQKLRLTGSTFLRIGAAANNTYGLPIITCEQATASVPVIFFRKGNASKIALEHDCIIAESTDHYGLVRIGDRIIYSMLGIMDAP